MRKIITIALLSAVSLGCAEKVYSDKEEGEIVGYDRTGVKDILALDIIEEIEIIPLEYSEQSLIGAEPKLTMYEGEYYVTDQSRGTTILRFDSKGKFLNKIGVIGNGPNEFLKINDYEVDPGLDNVYVYSNLNKSVYVYSREGDFKEKEDVGYSMIKMIKADDGYWIYFGFNNQYFRERLILTDNDGAVKQRHLPSDANIIVMYEDNPVLSRYKDKIFVRESLSNNIYQITGDSLRCVYTFDFGQYNIPEEFFKYKDPFEGGEFLLNRNFAIITNFFSNDWYKMVEVFIQKKDGSQLAYAINDSKRWRWVTYPMGEPEEREKNIFAGTAQCLTDDNELILLIEPYRLHSIPASVSALMINSEVLNNISEESNCVILKCKLKTT